MEKLIKQRAEEEYVNPELAEEEKQKGAKLSEEEAAKKEEERQKGCDTPGVQFNRHFFVPESVPSHV